MVGTPNTVTKRHAVEEVFEGLLKNGWLDPEKASRTAKELATDALEAKVFDGLKIDNLIEFGRVVHAEMNALMDAARRGYPVRDLTLYCTTFPCHGCARHIIAAGIERVVFIEPYPKSLVADLYPHAISQEGRAVDPKAVRFEPFVGVAPRRFMEWFGRSRRKDGAGYTLKWDAKSAQPVAATPFESYLKREAIVCARLAHAFESAGFTDPGESHERL